MFKSNTRFSNYQAFLIIFKHIVKQMFKTIIFLGFLTFYNKVYQPKFRITKRKSRWFAPVNEKA